MGKRIRKCKNCGRYTLSEECPKCSGPCRSPKPAAYSREDKYGKYRRLGCTSSNTLHQNE